MKRRDTYKQLENLFHSTVLPKISVNKKVMSAIYQDQKEMEEPKVKKKIGLLVTVGLLVGASTAIGAMQILQLKNEKGEVVYEITQQNKEHKLPQLTQQEQEQSQREDEEYERVLKIVNDIQNGLKPGTAVAAYVVPKLPKPENITYAPDAHPDVHMISKEFTFTKMAELQAKVGKVIPLPAELPGGYAFSKSYVFYKENNEFDLASMQEEAKTNNKEYVVREVGISNELKQVFVYYQGNKGKVTLRINNGQGIKGTITEGSQHDSAEKVTIGTNEAAYRVFNSPDLKSDKMLSWVKNGTMLSYNIYTDAEDMTKDELIKIAESILKAK